MSKLPIVLDDRDYPGWDSSTGKHYWYVARRASSKVEGRGNSPEEAIADLDVYEKMYGLLSAVVEAVPEYRRAYERRWILSKERGVVDEETEALKRLSDFERDAGRLRDRMRYDNQNNTSGPTRTRVDQGQGSQLALPVQGLP